MKRQYKSIAEQDNVDHSQFLSDIIPGNQPVVLRGYAKHWPAVHEGLQSPRDMINYLGAQFAGQDIEVFTAPEELQGQFFYGSDARQHNFDKNNEHFHSFLRKLHESVKTNNKSALYTGALRVDKNFPTLLQENNIALPHQNAIARLWIGNETTVPTHYDLSENLICVVAGRRKVTLFPPEQIENLYIGPLENTLAGQPISMVTLENPDLNRFPRYEKALESAQTTILLPGDALFIPYFWWHQIQALESFNVMVNFWWDETAAIGGDAFESLIHTILAIRNMPAHRKEIWQNVFQHLIFDNNNVTAHLPPDARGILGELTPDTVARTRNWLAKSLSR